MSPLSKRLTRKRLLLGIVGIGTLALVPVAVAAYTDATDTSGPTNAELSAVAPKPGAPAPAFTAIDTRGASHSLDAYRGRWVVLEWVNHSCPFTKKHYKSVDGRPGNTQAMQRDYATRVVWLSVVSSAPGKQGFTTPEEADELTREKGAAPTAVLRDTAGTLGRLYGARNTPQYAIIDPQGVLRYAGAIDSRQSSNVKDIATATNYVRAALDAGLAGNAIAVAQTQPYGCDVKY
jgi:cytochrome oxidase Cu insertion factor (SCO1/SenC/PrrC family)